MARRGDRHTLSTIKFTGLAYFQTVFTEQTVVDLDYGVRAEGMSKTRGAYWTYRWRWYCVSAILRVYYKTE